MNWVHLFTGFEGRISRTHFWIAWGAFVLLEIALWLATRGINDDRVTAVADLVMIYPQFAVCAKRGHDRNTPAWVIGAFFALAAVFDLLLLAGVLTIASVEQHTTLALVFAIPIAFFALVLIVDLGFRRGTRGPNRYGPDPLEVRT